MKILREYISTSFYLSTFDGFPRSRYAKNIYFEHLLCLSLSFSLYSRKNFLLTSHGLQLKRMLMQTTTSSNHYSTQLSIFSPSIREKCLLLLVIKTRSLTRQVAAINKSASSINSPFFLRIA